MSVIRDTLGAAALVGIAFLGGAAVENHLIASGKDGVLKQLGALIAQGVDKATEAAGGATGGSGSGSGGSGGYGSGSGGGEAPAPRRGDGPATFN